MKLLVNATILNQPRLTGLGVYTQNVLSLLLDRALETGLFDSVEVIGDRDRIETLLAGFVNHDRGRVVSCPTLNPVRRLVDLNRVVSRSRKEGPVLFYSPTHHGVVVQGVTQVITIHDVFARLFPANYRLQHLYFRYYLPRVLTRTRTVITVSTNTANDLARFYPDRPRTIPIHEAMRSDFKSVEPVEVPQLADRKYFLFVGPTYRYKNCGRLINAFAEYRRHGEGRLVFSGGRKAYLNTLRRQIDRECPHLREDIVFLGYVETGELVWLYQHALGLMMVTLYEGFGLPALEAMQCDCPVVAANAGALPEVTGDAAYFVDPENVESITMAMQTLDQDRQLRSRLVAKGKTNLKRFNWEKTAREVYAVLEACARADMN